MHIILYVFLMAKCGPILYTFIMVTSPGVGSRHNPSTGEINPVGNDVVSDRPVKNLKSNGR